ncbi:MAG: tetratricopeptide repeat protein, partial [Planctomycetaceae bacterium]|nr:tetratricopeptide repeat protein [Planctomycetaceae bacterium]
IRDFPAFLKSLDAKAEKTGQDSPLLRKIAGQVLQDKRQFDDAIKEYQLSLELQPFDGEVHEGLVKCYQESGQQDLAIRQLMKRIDFDRHNTSLYRQLVEQTTNRPDLAERAATSLVEQAPTEAESHQALAELRESQDRYSEAISHWRRVAELRSLEPTGLLKLAEAQAHIKDAAGAKQTLKALRSRQWPERFGDVDDRIHTLEESLTP